MTTTVVFGASGYVGTNLVTALAYRGYRVRAAARGLAVLQGRGWKDVELVPADALNSETLDHALQGIEVAYYLVHSMASGPEFSRVDL